MSLGGVLHFNLSWQVAAIAAACMLALAATVRRVPQLAWRPRVRHSAAVLQEAGTLGILFALYQAASQYSLLGLGHALSRAQWIWHAERVLHLPDEASVQSVILPHPVIVQGFNLFYAALHFTALVIWLTWLFVRHRDRYRQWRTTLVLLTFGCLLVQLLPVAPPRMLSGLGLVDTAQLYRQSVYGSHAGFTPDQLSAMPSVHVGWAVLIALTAVCVSRSRWRWLVLVYPALTTLAVVVTANHFWLDGIAAVGVLGLALLLQVAVRARLRGVDVAGRIPRWAAWIAPPRPALQPVVPRSPLQPPAPWPAADGAASNGQPAVEFQVNGHVLDGQPVNGQPVNGRSVNGQPVNGQPVNGQRVNGRSVNGRSVNGEPLNGQRANCQPLNDRPVNGQPGSRDDRGLRAGPVPGPARGHFPASHPRPCGLPVTTVVLNITCWVRRRGPARKGDRRCSAVRGPGLSCARYRVTPAPSSATWPPGWSQRYSSVPAPGRLTAGLPPPASCLAAGRARPGRRCGKLGRVVQRVGEMLIAERRSPSGWFVRDPPRTRPPCARSLQCRWTTMRLCGRALHYHVLLTKRNVLSTHGRGTHRCLAAGLLAAPGEEEGGEQGHAV